jgi:hypothetical protein
MKPAIVVMIVIAFAAIAIRAVYRERTRQSIAEQRIERLRRARELNRRDDDPK